jgi:hypothetical protein
LASRIADDDVRAVVDGYGHVGLRPGAPAAVLAELPLP